ncbi:MAG: methyltransferase domain-containing protein [Promethearchaeota archaeon]
MANRYQRRIIHLISEIITEIKFMIIDIFSRSIKAKRYDSVNKLKLNLGCGKNLKAGFINIDIKRNADLRLDLRNSLPFKDNTVDYIYSSQFFEHIDYYDRTAINCLYDYLRILKKGGTLRMVVPDLEKFFNAYVDKDKDFFLMFSRIFKNIKNRIPKFGKYTSIDYINLIYYQSGFGFHKYNYDFEKIHNILQNVGFRNIKKVDFNPEIDPMKHRSVSLYIHAEK